MIVLASIEEITVMVFLIVPMGLMSFTATALAHHQISSNVKMGHVCQPESVAMVKQIAKMDQMNGDVAMKPLNMHVEMEPALIVAECVMASMTVQIIVMSHPTVPGAVTPIQCISVEMEHV